MAEALKLTGKYKKKYAIEGIPDDEALLAHTIAAMKARGIARTRSQAWRDENGWYTSDRRKCRAACAIGALALMNGPGSDAYVIAERAFGAESVPSGNDMLNETIDRDDWDDQMAFGAAYYAAME